MRENQVRSLGWEDSLEKGNDNTLQYSFLENPMDGTVWQVTVHGVTKNHTSTLQIFFELFSSDYSSIFKWLYFHLSKRWISYQYTNIIKSFSLLSPYCPAVYSLPFFLFFTPQLLQTNEEFTWYSCFKIVLSFIISTRRIYLIHML